MSIDLTTDNPPNPRQAHAGNVADENFFQDLAETLNAGFSHNNLHIYSQSFDEDTFTIQSGTSTDDMIKVYFPPLSTAHTSIKVKIRCVKQGGSGTIKASVRNMAGSSLASFSSSVQNTNGTFHNKDLTLDNITLTKSNTVLELRVGGSASSGGYVEISDVHVSWSPLTSSTIAPALNPTGGPFIPIGTGMTSDNEPMSAALGKLLMVNAEHLQKRPVNFASVSGVRFTGATASSASHQYIEPFVRPHIVRVCDTDDTIRIEYMVRAHNSSNTSKEFRIKFLDAQSLFDFRTSEANHMEESDTHRQFASHSVAAGADAAYNGSIEIARPFDELGFDLAGCSFIAIGICTSSMIPRDVFGFGEFDESLRIRSYSFWSE